MIRRALVATAGVSVTIALTLTSGSAIASPVTAEKPDPAVSKTISKAAQEKTKDYWTTIADEEREERRPPRPRSQRGDV